MYSLHDFGRMITDTVRTGAYLEALRSFIGPGSTVVDLGAGTGILAMLACQAGASRVYAIDPSDAIKVAQDVMEANGFSAHITCIQKRSPEVSLPERADIIVFDLHGILPLFSTAILDIIDARKHLLSYRGVLIPMRDILKVALVESEESHRLFTTPWRDAPYDLNLDLVAHYTTNTWLKQRIIPEQLLTEPDTLGVLDYRTIDSPNLNSSIEQVIQRDGTAHGIIVWFDSELSETVTISNAPGAPELIYGQAFFPFSDAVPVQQGDRVDISIRADLTGEDYTWQWKTRFFARNAERKPRISFSQSTFHGQPLSREKLAQREAEYTPTLSQEGLIERFILDSSDGTTQLNIIAEGLCRMFPKRFPTPQSALNRVASSLKGCLD